MRRWLNLLLLVLLPLQISWAIAGANCQHELTDQANHFGHHLHAHQDLSADSNEPDSNSQHSDCESCLISLISLPAQMPITRALPPATPQIDHFSLSLIFRPSTPPERPNWLTLHSAG